MSKKPSEPSPPDVMQTADQAFEAQVRNVPKLIDTQKQYGPELTRQLLSEVEQFAPQILQLQQKLEGEFSPETESARKVLNEYFSQEQDLTPFEERQARETVRSAQSARGLGQTGFGAQEELRGLTALRQQIKAQRLGLAMQMAQGGTTQSGMVQGLTSVSPVANLGLQNVDPSQIFGLASNNFSNLMKGFETRADLRGQDMGLINEGAGGAMTAAATVLAAKIPVGCFSPETMIGDTPISKIKVGDMVDSKDGQARVVGVFIDNKPTNLVINGINTTNEHPWVLSDGKLVGAKDIKVGDVLYGDIVVETVEHKEYGYVRHNIETENHYFMVDNNYLVHDGREVQ